MTRATVVCTYGISPCFVVVELHDDITFSAGDAIEVTPCAAASNSVVLSEEDLHVLRCTIGMGSRYFWPDDLQMLRLQRAGVVSLRRSQPHDSFVEWKPTEAGVALAARAQARSDRLILSTGAYAVLNKLVNEGSEVYGIDDSRILELERLRLAHASGARSPESMTKWWSATEAGYEYMGKGREPK